MLCESRLHGQTSHYWGRRGLLGQRHTKNGHQTSRNLYSGLLVSWSLKNGVHFSFGPSFLNTCNHWNPETNAAEGLNNEGIYPSCWHCFAAGVHKESCFRRDWTRISFKHERNAIASLTYIRLPPPSLPLCLCPSFFKCSNLSIYG